MPILHALHVFLVLSYLLLAPGTFALDLAPGTYAISAVVANPSTCLGHYLAYDTTTAWPDVYLISSDTSQPPLWRVDTGINGTFTLTTVNRTVPAVLTYAAYSCSDTAVSLRVGGNSTWVNAKGFLNTTMRRDCPRGSGVVLAPTATNGTAACRALQLVPPAPTPPRIRTTTWHFRRHPSPATELFTKYYRRPVESWADWALMDDSLLVEWPNYSFYGPPVYWQRDASGVWRRGILSASLLHSHDISVGLGANFLALCLRDTGRKAKMPFWRVHVYDKADLARGPTATLAPRNDTVNEAVAIAAGGNNIIVANHPENNALAYTRGKDGKWSSPVAFAIPKQPGMVQMSKDGRTLAMSMYGEEIPVGKYYEVVSSGYALVYRQTREGGPWVQEAKIQRPASMGLLIDAPMIVIAGNTLIVAFQYKQKPPGRLFFYRRSAKGVWKLEQTATAPPGYMSTMAGDGDTLVMRTSNEITAHIYVYQQSKATGKWAVGKARPLPRWRDDFAKAAGRYGAMAVAGKRLAITAVFHTLARSSPGVTFLYDDFNDI